MKTLVAGDEMPDRETIAEIEAIFHGTPAFPARSWADKRLGCPICSFSWLMVWREIVEVISPPTKLRGTVLWFEWRPYVLDVERVLCPNCAWYVERHVH